MPKGSQLTQLKSALSQAGFTGRPQQSKKRKRTTAVEKDKEKKAAKLEEIHRKLNPFDVKVTKLKHDVGGRKIKGAIGKPAQSKQVGLDQRKKTLLKEYEEKGRAGGILDRRFGENDPSMSVEERMLERFTRERQRASKGVAFNLEDEDELTHYGQSLSKLDDFDDVGLGDEDDEDEETGDLGQIDKEIVKHTHFGGFDDEEEEDDPDEPARKKSKAEVMEEVIAKSKQHKLLRQMEKEKGETIRHELDEEFAAIRDLIYAPDPSRTGDVALPLDPKVVADTQAEVPSESKNTGQDVDYDQQVRELAFDKRSKPKDRMKTEEEVALEEKEALETAERQRRKRMLGLPEDDSEDEGRAKRKRKRGGDDLDDDFQDDEGDWGGLGAGLGEEDKVEGSISDSESQGERSGEESQSGDEDSEEEDSQVESGEEWEDSKDPGTAHQDLAQSSKPKSRKGNANETKGLKKELPYTFPCPATHDEFLEIVNDVDDKDVPIVVKRIRALFHTSLAPENKFKLQTFMTVLIDHILYLTSPPAPRFGLLSSILPHLFAFVKAYPIRAAEHFNQKLSLMHKNLKRGLSRGALNPDSKTWPGLAELSLLRVIGVIWSTSDLNHAVVSPARMLMGAYLGLGRIRTLSDLASGLFLCTLFLHYETLSKRLVPEAVNFLINAILHLAPHHFKDVSSLPGSFPAQDFRSELTRSLSIDLQSAANVLVGKADLPSLLDGDESSNQRKADLLGLTIALLGRFANMYKGLDGFIELYDPICQIVTKIDVPKAYQVRVQLSDLRSMLNKLLKFARQSRQPLLLQSHKPIPIPTYIPKFETSSSSHLRHRDPDHERNEASKLRAQYKQEKKGAIRELRKDARFLAAVEQDRQKEKDRSYNERMGKVFSSIEGERAEQKAMEKEKVKEKRRGGRR
ncbi:Nop14-like protein [Pluteus cervinus]|uniref:Nop14-like protein n=1 Tax=Pluteus cervinus TaxID=181527 RepID=A0ACD3B2F2_9AGAR|nr:Nop14-like protein [Pluteus cervinus]